MKKNKQIAVTAKQNDYLMGLADGGMTTRQFIDRFGGCSEKSAKVIRQLRSLGLITSTRLYRNTHIHELIHPYLEMISEGVIQVSTHRPNSPIPEEQLYYAAILRNSGYIGYRLVCQFHKIFPERPEKSVRCVVRRAMDMRLCGWRRREVIQ